MEQNSTEIKSYLSVCKRKNKIARLQPIRKTSDKMLLVFVLNKTVEIVALNRGKTYWTVKLYKVKLI